MIVAFIDWSLRELCEDEDKCILFYGEEATIQLQNRLLDLFAAESLLDILVGNLKEVKLDKYLGFELDLNDKFKLVFIPNHTDFKDFMEEDFVNLSALKRVKIISINKHI